MSTEHFSLWPARVVSDVGEWGDQHDRVRAFVYTRDDNTTRLVVLSADGHIVTKTDVIEHRYNGDGYECVDPDGRLWRVVAIAGCRSCGGSTSAARAFEMLRGQGEDE